MTGYLLFQPASPDSKVAEDSGAYLPVDVDDFEPVHAENILMLGRKPDETKASAAEKAALDAHYDSDGEVSELTMTVPATFYEPPEVEDVAAVAVDSC